MHLRLLIAKRCIIISFPFFFFCPLGLYFKYFCNGKSHNVVKQNAGAIQLDAILNIYDVIFSKKHAGILILALFPLLLLFYPILELFFKLISCICLQIKHILSNIYHFIESIKILFFFLEFWRCSFLSSPFKHENISF